MALFALAASANEFDSELDQLFKISGPATLPAPVRIAKASALVTKPTDQRKRKSTEDEDQLSKRKKKVPKATKRQPKQEEEVELHYETRRQPQTEEGETVEEEEAEAVEEEAVPEAEVEDDKERTVFVGNLPVSSLSKAGTRDLRQKFEVYGPIESIRFRSVPVGNLKMPRKIAARNQVLSESRDSANAYIKFKTSQAAQLSLVENGLIYEERHLRVDLESAAKKQPDHRRSIFVGNLPFIVSDEHLWSTFADCGEIESVRVVRDPATNFGKGFGFVTFKDKSSIGLAMQLEGATIEKRDIRITRAVDPTRAARRKDSANKSNKAAAAAFATRKSRGKDRQASAPKRPERSSFEGAKSTTGDLPMLKRKRSMTAASKKK